MIKATKVDGVYAADPVTDPTAKRYTRLNYNEVLARQLGVMDTTAIVLCRDHQMPLRVIDMGQVGMLQSAVEGKEIGTLISNEE
jgi:uridylate kinase